MGECGLKGKGDVVIIELEGCANMFAVWWVRSMSVETALIRKRALLGKTVWQEQVDWFERGRSPRGQ
jgi:hypothetical protein